MPADGQASECQHVYREVPFSARTAIFILSRPISRPRRQGLCCCRRAHLNGLLLPAAADRPAVAQRAPRMQVRRQRRAGRPVLGQRSLGAVVAADAPQSPGHALPACVVPCGGVRARAASRLRDSLVSIQEATLGAIPSYPCLRSELRTVMCGSRCACDTVRNVGSACVRRAIPATF